MVQRILYNETDRMPAVTDFDLVIIDEAHRGYILDKEMAEEEIVFRDQLDYQSKYRNIIEYFDAVKIGFTATPALQTTQIFGEPIYTYSYRRAVYEGYLCDHDAPFMLSTTKSREGIHFKAGEIVPKYDPNTQEIVNEAVLPDELDYDVEKFNDQIVVPDFNKKVFEELTEKYIMLDSPDTFGKTLIFAVNDAHADPTVVQFQVNQLIAKLQRKKNILTDKAVSDFKTLSGGETVDSYIKNLLTLSPTEAQTQIIKDEKLFKIIDEDKPLMKKIIIDDTDDGDVQVTRGYGKHNLKKPEDYLEEFSTFIQDNKDKITALNIVCTKPASLTRASLKSLCVQLANEGYDLNSLNTAINNATNADMTVDIINIIRRYAVGSPLLNHEERIHRAFQKLKTNHNFNPVEQHWLAIIESNLMVENTIDESIFDSEVIFRNKGGFKRIDKEFNIQLKALINELNIYLYEDIA